ncbi:MAG: haloacid dehalogenase type II [Hyphomicrobium sp.]
MAGENGCYVFDAFGTLFDVHSAAHRYAARLGPDWARLSDIWRTKQLEYTWVNAGIGRHASFRGLTRDALLFALNAVQLDPVLADDLMADYERLAVYPDAAEALATLKARDARLAILSNGDPDMLNALVTANGLDGVFDAVLSVSSANTFKPVPRVYALATEALGGSAGDITFLSSNRWDIAGATAFGFQTVWVNRAAQPDEYHDLAPSRTISSLAGLISAA